MSDFLLNLARRSAGLGASVSIEPASDPVFSPGDWDTSLRYEEPGEDLQPASKPARPTETGREQAAPPLRPVAEQSMSLVNVDASLPLDEELLSEHAELKQNRSRVAIDRSRIDISPHDVNVQAISPAVPTSFESQAESVDSIAEPQFSIVSSDANLETPNSTRSFVAHAPSPRAHALRQEDSYAERTIPARQFSNRLVPGTAEETATTTIESNFLENGPSIAVMDQQQSLPPIQVSIGTIEVRADQPPAVRPPSRALQTPKRGFDDYKLIR